MYKRQTDTFTYRDSGIKRISFSMNISENRLRRVFPRYPFVPSSSEDIQNRCLYILSIQSHGLKKRLEQIKSDKAVIGISGGLDSTLALIVTVRAFRLMNKPAKDISVSYTHLDVYKRQVLYLSVFNTKYLYVLNYTIK